MTAATPKQVNGNTSAWRRVGTSLVLAGLILFYFWTALTSGDGQESETRTAYPLLARAFLEGQLYLDVAPDPRLLALPDPYDSNTNGSLRFQDASLYHGKYYLYFGAAPAILLFAPYLLVTGHDFPQYLAVPLFCSAGLICSAALFLLILRDHFPKVSSALKLAALFSLGMANTCPFLLRRPDVYEVAISCAYCLMQLVFLLFYYALRHPRQGRPALWIAAASIAACVGARYNDVFAVAVFVAFIVGMEWPLQKRGKWEIGGLMPLTPIPIIGAGIAWYNFARFDNPFEFGQHYQLAAMQMHSLQLLRLSNLPYNLWFYFLAPPYLSAKFPFIDAYPYVWFSRPDYYFSLEKIAGLFFLSPLSLFALTLPVLIRQRRNPGERPLILTLGLMAVSSIANLMPLLFFSGATMRYFVDFAPSLIFLGCIMACHFEAAFAKQPWGKRWLAHSFFLTVMCLGCWNGLLLSFTGYYDLLQQYHPKIYAFVEQLFRPVEFVAQTLSHWLH